MERAWTELWWTIRKEPEGPLLALANLIGFGLVLALWIYG